MLLIYSLLGAMFFSYLFYSMDSIGEMTPTMLLIIVALSIVWPVSAVHFYLIHRRSKRNGKN